MGLNINPRSAKDGVGTTIPGGVAFNDQSGSGAGPFSPAIVVIDSAQGEVLGTTADDAYGGSGAGGLIGLLKGLYARLAALPTNVAAETGGNLATAAAALGLIYDKLTGSVEVTAASLPLPTGAAAESGGNLAAAASALGATNGAGVITDADGTIQQYLRGIVKLVIAKLGVKAASGDLADGALVTLGAKADAKSAATDATAVTLMQVAKQISASVQALQTALASLTNSGNALDINIKSGFNTNGRKTPTNSAPVVSASQTAQAVGAGVSAGALGSTGGVGDWLDFLVIQPGTTAAGAVSIIDGSSTIYTWPGGGTTALLTLAPIVVPIRAACATAWKITTGANVTAVGVGNFT
jgi:hypothetical protein